MNGTSRSRRLQGSRSLLAAVAALGLLLSASCAPAADPDAIAAALTQLDDEWSKAAATRNADSVASFYAADAIAYPPDAPVATGQAAARDVWAAGFADSTYSISWTTARAGVSKSGDLGYTAGTYQESYRGPDGNTITMKGKYLCVWAKQADGSWKATNDMWNADSR
jgi:ketosteroid isomerase-like protein